MPPSPAAPTLHRPRGPVVESAAVALAAAPSWKMAPWPAAYAPPSAPNRVGCRGHRPAGRTPGGRSVAAAPASRRCPQRHVGRCGRSTPPPRRGSSRSQSALSTEMARYTSRASDRRRQRTIWMLRQWKKREMRWWGSSAAL